MKLVTPRRHGIVHEYSDEVVVPNDRLQGLFLKRQHEMHVAYRSHRIGASSSFTKENEVSHHCIIEVRSNGTHVTPSVPAVTDGRPCPFSKTLVMVSTHAVRCICETSRDIGL